MIRSRKGSTVFDMLGNMLEVSEKFPPLPLKSGLASYASRFGADPGKYASLCAFVSVFPAFLLSLFFLADPLFFLASLFLLYSLFFLFFLMLPKLSFE